MIEGAYGDDFRRTAERESSIFILSVAFWLVIFLKRTLFLEFNFLPIFARNIFHPEMVICDRYEKWLSTFYIILIHLLVVRSGSTWSTDESGNFVKVLFLILPCRHRSRIYLRFSINLSSDHWPLILPSRVFIHIHLVIHEQRVMAEYLSGYYSFECMHFTSTMMQIVKYDDLVKRH